MSCNPYIIANSNLGKQLGLSKDTSFNSLDEIKELINKNAINNKSRDSEIYQEAAKRAIDVLRGNEDVVLTEKQSKAIDDVFKEFPAIRDVFYKAIGINPKLQLQDFKTKIGEQSKSLKDSEEDAHKTINNSYAVDTNKEVLHKVVEGLYSMPDSNPYIDNYNPKSLESFLLYEFNGRFDKKQLTNIIGNYRELVEKIQIQHKLFVLGEKEGVSELPNNLADLQQKEQAKQLYQKYLNSIFPDSKVKDIVYHHSDTKITEFKKEFPEGYAARHGVSPKAKFFLRQPLKEEFLSKRPYLGQYLVNIINPNVMPVNADRSAKRNSGIKEGIQEALNNNQDGAIFDNIWDNRTWSDVLVVFEPEQIHILGSKQDLQQAKEFVNSKSTSKKQVVFDTTNLTKEKRRGFIEVIRKEFPNANIQYKLMELNPELAKERIKAQLERGENRANVPDSTIDRHAESYKQMLEDIKEEGISNYDDKKNDSKFSTVDSNFNDFIKDGFFKNYNITVQEYDSIKEALGYNNSQMIDMVSKFVAINKGESLDKATAYFAFMLLGKDNNKIRSDLRYRISNWKKYKELFAKYKEEVFQERKFINDKKKWKNLIRDKIIIDYLAETIVEYYNNPTEFEKINDKKWTKEDFTFIKKLYNFIKKVLRNLGITNEDRNFLLNNTAKNIAHDILNKEYSIYNYKLEKNQVLKYYNNTIESDEIAKNIVSYFQQLKLILTGSLALRKAGTIYRPETEDLHDLDFVVSYEEINKEVIKNIKRFQGNDINYASKVTLLYIPEFDWYKKIKEKYPNITILNGFYGKEHNSFNSYTVTSVINGEFYENNGKHEKLQKDGSIKIVEHKKGDWIENTGYVIDFFIRLEPHQEEHENYFKLWKEIMIAKLLMNRNKDLTDFKEFVPYLKSIDKYNFYYPDWVYSVRDKTDNSNLENLNSKNSNNFENFENLFEEVVKKYPNFTKEDFDILNNEQKQALKKCL